MLPSTTMMYQLSCCAVTPVVVRTVSEQPEFEKMFSVALQKLLP